MVPNISEVQNETFVKNGEIIPGKFIVVFNSDTFKASIIRSYEESQLQAQKYMTAFMSEFGIPAKQIDQVYGAAISGFSA